MDIKFEYEYSGRSYFGDIYRPVAKVSFNSVYKEKWIDVWMIVDTGADFTILPKYLAKDLGVSLSSDGIKQRTTGVGGDQPIYMLRKKLVGKLGAFERNIPVAFIDGNSVPPLLGRVGFLDTFDIEFLRTRNVIFKG